MKISLVDKFPKDFLFGGATSSFQFEGGWREDGRAESNYDHIKRSDDITDFSVASDHYHRFAEDIALLKELGLDSYRLSVSWSRVLPDGKTVNKKGIDFYTKVINLLIESDIEPILTIYHFEYPQKLIEDFGGWKSRDSIDAYLLLVDTLLQHFGSKVKYWITINEQDHLLKFSERLGINKGKNDIEKERVLHQANYYMCVATSKAIKRIRKFNKDAKVGPAVNPMPAYPKSSHPEDVFAAKVYEELSHYYILDLHIKGYYSPIYKKYLEDRNIFPEVNEKELQLMKDNPPNIIGVNYYMNQTVQRSQSEEIGIRDDGVFVEEETGIYKIANNEYLTKTEWGWNISPEGLRIGLIDLYNRYQIPMIITENGLGANDILTEDKKIHDPYRIDFIEKHLKEIKYVISLGIPVIGYTVWSAIDLVSGREGMDKRYGFVYVNRTNHDLKDLKRFKKDSFYWYQNVIQTRGELI